MNATVVNIALGHVYSAVSDPNLMVGNYTVKTIVRNVCRAHPNGFRFSKKYKMRHWDGYDYLSNGHTFPTGLISYVVHRLKKAGATVSIDYGDYADYIGHDVTIPHDYLKGITLRNYQIEAAETLLRSGRGIAKMATNSGKTEIMSAVVQYLNKQTIVIVPWKSLMYQTAERISKRLGVSVGMLGDGIYDLQPITVCIIDSLRNRIKYDPEFLKFISANEVMIIDECHNASASESLLEVISNIPGMFRFGFSATPLKHDRLSDLRLIGITGKILYEVTNDQLIEMGHSARPEVRLITLKDHSKSSWELDYQEAYKELIVENSIRNRHICKICDSHANSVILILVSRVKHGKLLHKLMPGSHFIYGNSSKEARDEFIGMMNTKPGIYIVNKIFDEGVDVPAINVQIFACGGLSDNRQLQRIGRGLREKKSGENKVILYDFIDDTNRYLLKHSAARVDVYVREGFDVSETTT